ncbi:MAG: menaquinone biosynthetic enzyme MqnA/MqnD family protein, partial [Thermodesulfobacteriota bacterium]
MNEKIKLGKFNYTNVLPVYHRLEQYLPENCCNLSEGPPAVLNSALADEVLDLSPVSAFSYALYHEKWIIVPDLSISCTGSVISVLLCSDLKFSELDKKRILLTNESASAASLLRVLFFEKGIYPEFHSGDIKKLNKDNYDAALVIGDNALYGKWDNRFENVYDLGKLWHDMTGFSFVFGLWAVSKKAYKNKKLSIEEIAEILINNKNRNLSDFKKLTEYAAEKNNTSADFMEKYFRYIEYDFLPEKIKGLEYFYDL